MKMLLSLLILSLSFSVFAADNASKEDSAETVGPVAKVNCDDAANAIKDAKIAGTSSNSSQNNGPASSAVKSD